MFIELSNKGADISDSPAVGFAWFCSFCVTTYPAHHLKSVKSSVDAKPLVFQDRRGISCGTGRSCDRVVTGLTELTEQDCGLTWHEKPMELRAWKRRENTRICWPNMLLCMQRCSTPTGAEKRGRISQLCPLPETLTSFFRSLIVRLSTMNPLEMQHFRRLSHKHQKVIWKC